MRSMTVAPVLVALACAMPIGAWWSMQLPGISSAAPGGAFDASVQALRVLLVVQLLSVCLLHQFWMRPLPSIAMTLIPTWPLVAMLGLAAGAPVTMLIGSQVLMAALALVLSAGAVALRHLLHEHAAMRTLHNTVAIGAAALVWSYRADWLGWLGV